MKQLPLPLLLTPAAHAVETFNYDTGYRHYIRNFFRDKTREEWRGMNELAKNHFRTAEQANSSDLIALKREMEFLGRKLEAYRRWFYSGVND